MIESGNIIELRKGFACGIGAEWLQLIKGLQPAVKLTIDEIKAIKAAYRAKARGLEK